MIDDYACNPGFRCIMGIISKIGYVYLFFLLACFGIGCIGYTITELTDNTPQVPDTSWKYDFSDMEGRVFFQNCAAEAGRRSENDLYLFAR